MSNNGDGCECDWSVIQTFLGWPLIIGGAGGLAACVLYPVARKPSGIFLLSGAILASPLPLIIAVGSWQYLGSLIFFFCALFRTQLFRKPVVVSRRVASFSEDSSHNQEVARRRMDTLA
jgi:hypothetical protein